MQLIPIMSIYMTCVLFLVKNHWVILCSIKRITSTYNACVSLQCLWLDCCPRVISRSVQIHINLFFLYLKDSNFSRVTWCSPFPIYLLSVTFTCFTFKLVPLEVISSFPLPYIMLWGCGVAHTIPALVISCPVLHYQLSH